MRNKANGIVVVAPTKLANGQRHQRGRVVVRVKISKGFGGVDALAGEPIGVDCQNCHGQIFDYDGYAKYRDGAVKCGNCDFAYPIQAVGRKPELRKKPEPKKPEPTFQPRRQNKPWSRKATA